MLRREYALKTFVRQVLALRLLAAGVIVAIAFGAIAYARGYERIGESAGSPAPRQPPPRPTSASEIRGEHDTTMAIESMVQWWREVNGASRAPASLASLPDRDPDDGCRIHRTTWDAGSANAAPVVFYRAEGGGHALPSIDHPLRLGPLARRLIGPVCRDVDGAGLAWEFFRRHAAS